MRSAQGTAEPPWVLSVGAAVNLCVSFQLHHPNATAGDAGDAAPLLHVDVQTVDVWEKNSQQTAFGSTLLATPGRYSFLSLLVPVRATDLPSSGAGRSFVSTIKHTAQGVQASVTWAAPRCSSGAAYCGTKLELSLGDQGQGQWLVKRTKLKTDDDIL